MPSYEISPQGQLRFFTLSRMVNEYRPKCEDAGSWAVIGAMAHSICGKTYGWHAKLYNTSLMLAHGQLNTLR